MDLDIEITAIKRKSDRRRFAVGEQIGKHGYQHISGFEIEEKDGKVNVFVLTRLMGTGQPTRVPLENL